MTDGLWASGAPSYSPYLSSLNFLLDIWLYFVSLDCSSLCTGNGNAIAMLIIHAQICNNAK